MGLRDLFLIEFMLLSMWIGISAGYDYFVLAQQWPPSLCNLHGAQCNPPAKDNFTIHGLWPNNDNPPHPERCTTTRFDPTQVQAIRTRLLQDWPNVYDGTDPESFWQGEWAVHGTCSEYNFDQFHYFNVALRRKDDYDFVQALRTAGFTPGTNPVLSSDVEDAISNAVGVQARIRCNGPGVARSQLYEVLVCLDHTATTYIDCPDDVRSRCNRVIRFPLQSAPPVHEEQSPIPLTGRSPFSSLPLPFLLLAVPVLLLGYRVYSSGRLFPPRPVVKVD